MILKRLLHQKEHQRHAQLKKSKFLFKFSFVKFFLLIDRCHLEPFISLVNKAKQRGEITEGESTMPLYEMVAEFLVGIGAQ